ncbi:hypothetical protein UPYG_G00214760 [Umbra pygmaea]|uniref:C2H2-type domain-containing protein n=1 Tax=Umbra pygmaea TaxID=75934 RepID=A0ABD0WM50_UMBPY
MEPRAKMTHVTVRKAADGRAVLSQCLKSQLYYCPFCQPSIFKPRDYASVMTHIESHRLKAVLHREFTIFICHLECRTAKHFHCPYCPKTYVNRRDFTKHIPQSDQQFEVVRLLMAYILELMDQYPGSGSST